MIRNICIYWWKSSSIRALIFVTNVKATHPTFMVQVAQGKTRSPVLDFYKNSSLLPAQRKFGGFRPQLRVLMRTDRHRRVQGFEAGNGGKEEKDEISDIIKVIDIVIKLLCRCVWVSKRDMKGVRGAYVARRGQGPQRGQPARRRRHVYPFERGKESCFYCFVYVTSWASICLWLVLYLAYLSFLCCGLGFTYISTNWLGEQEVGGCRFARNLFGGCVSRLCYPLLCFPKPRLSIQFPLNIVLAHAATLDSSPSPVWGGL